MHAIGEAIEFKAAAHDIDMTGYDRSRREQSALRAKAGGTAMKFQPQSATTGGAESLIDLTHRSGQAGEIRNDLGHMQPPSAGIADDKAHRRIAVVTIDHAIDAKTVAFKGTR